MMKVSNVASIFFSYYFLFRKETEKKKILCVSKLLGTPLNVKQGFAVSFHSNTRASFPAPVVFWSGMSILTYSGGGLLCVRDIKIRCAYRIVGIVLMSF